MREGLGRLPLPAIRVRYLDQSAQFSAQGVCGDGWLCERAAISAGGVELALQFLRARLQARDLPSE